MRADTGCVRKVIGVSFTLIVFIGTFTSVPHLSGRTLQEKGNYGSVGGPALTRMDLEAHDINAVYLMVSNQGPIGLNLETGNGTGFFPSNTSNNYVFGTGLWFGARYDADGDGDLDRVFTQGYNPLAGDSEFREGRNDQDMDDPLTRVFDSLARPEQGDEMDLEEWPDQFRLEDPETGELVPFIRSDQDRVTTYTTKDKPPVFGGFTMPLEGNQRCMAFKFGLAAEAIFFILDIGNGGYEVMKSAWVGFEKDMDVGVSFADDVTRFIRNRITPEGDTTRVNMAYAWDSDFTESNFIGDPGFVGIAYLGSPGNPFDGVDNDIDGLVDESPFNGFDDDGDGTVDEADEVDELGLVNYSKHCSPSVPCEVIDPQTDQDGFDLISCVSENNPDSSSGIVCLESTAPSDIRYMMSSGPFDWLPGQTQQVVLAMVFANAVGGPDRLDFIGDPPRPDPNDPALDELLQVKDVIQGIFDLSFLQAAPPPAPNMALVPGEGQVTILWDDLPLRTPDRTYDDFVQLDPEYREFDFEGFRVWRSRTGNFSRRGDVNDPDFPLTPEAIEENDLVAGFDLKLLAQFDLANGITTGSNGVTCSDSLILEDDEILYTDCDTFNLGSDTGLRFSYIDHGDPGAPLINGFRYFYSVTAYDFNSGVLPVSRLSLDSGVSFPAENSLIPRSNASSFVDALASLYQVDAHGEAIDDTSSSFVSMETGELAPPEAVRARNALVDFEFSPGAPERISDTYYTLVLDRFERLDNSTNRIGYYVEDAAGERMNLGSVESFDMPCDGTNEAISVSVFDPEDSTQVLFTTDLTFNVDAGAFVYNLSAFLFGENAAGADISDSLGGVTTSQFLPASYRASDLRIEWMEVGPGSLTVNVVDLDNAMDVPFGGGIVSENGDVNESEKGFNWSFLPVVAGLYQPGGRYFLTTSPLNIADLWLSGIRVTTTMMDRMPREGDAWTLRQLAMAVEVDTTVTPNDTTYFDAQRPPVPGTRYRINTQSGGQDLGGIDLTKIRVVPNPYIATSAFELGPTQRLIQFINLPSECTIRIYTISGNLVQAIEHTPDEGGTEIYNLRTRYDLPLASGNYYYHVTTPDGKTHLGRFAVIQ